jgi:hypothetical protein
MSACVQDICVHEVCACVHVCRIYVCMSACVLDMCAHECKNAGYDARWARVHACMLTCVFMPACVQAITPAGRGFNESLTMLSGSEDHFTQHDGGAGVNTTHVDLWATDTPATGSNGTCVASVPPSPPPPTTTTTT